MRPIYYTHFHGIEPLPEPAIEVFFGGDRIGIASSPCAPARIASCSSCSRSEFDDFRSDPQGEFNKLFDGLYGMRARMRNAVPDGKIVGAKGIDNYFRKPFGPGWALTGDAAYLKDPSTGSGIGDALQQSVWLAEALDDWFKGADWETRHGRVPAAARSGHDAHVPDDARLHPEPRIPIRSRLRWSGPCVRCGALAVCWRMHCPRLLCAGLPATDRSRACRESPKPSTPGRRPHRTWQCRSIRRRGNTADRRPVVRAVSVALRRRLTPSFRPPNGRSPRRPARATRSMRGAQARRSPARVVAVAGDNVRHVVAHQEFGSWPGAALGSTGQRIGVDLNRDSGRDDVEQDGRVSLHVLIAFGVGQDWPDARRMQLTDGVQE